jgi:hypothetical protein
MSNRMTPVVTPQVAAVIGMTVAQANDNVNRASRLAAAKLRAMGYARKYCTSAWNRGQRWYAPGSVVPLADAPAVQILGAAINGN